GGAGRAAFRLHQGLLAAGYDSAMVVGRKVSEENSVYVAPSPEPASSFCWGVIERSYLHPRRAPISNTWFSIGYPGVDVGRHPDGSFCPAAARRSAPPIGLAARRIPRLVRRGLWR